MKTTRLFDQNSHLYTFTAAVLSAEAAWARRGEVRSALFMRGSFLWRWWRICGG